MSLEAVKKILTSCPRLSSINLSSCRGLPRGVKRLMQGAVEIKELRENLGVENKEVLQMIFIRKILKLIHSTNFSGKLKPESMNLLRRKPE